MLRTAAKLIMYHGTATGPDNEILRSILKEGLNPEPKRRSFDVDESKAVQDRLYESLGGVYFSVNINDISKFSGIAARKLGGNYVAVIAQIETRTPAVTIDEDDLFPLDLQRNKIADQYFADVYRLNAHADLYLRFIEDNKINYNEIAKWFIDNKLRQQWDISPQESQRVLPVIANVARLQVETYLAAEYERQLASGSPYLKKDVAPQEPAAVLFGRLKQVVREALRIVRKAAEPSKIDWRRDYHKVRITEPVGYSGANRILAVLHWSDNWERYKQTGYYDVGEVDYLAKGAEPYVQRVLDDFLQSHGKNALWRGPNGEVLYDHRDPEFVEKAATVLYRGALYRQAGDNQALVLVHVDSLATMMDIDPAKAAWAFTELQKAARSFPGPVVVVTQGWHVKEAQAIIATAEANPHGAHVIQFDEDVQAWGPFLKRLDALLRKLAVRNVVVGGFWYDEDSGCAREVDQFLQRRGYATQVEYAWSYDELDEDF